MKISITQLPPRAVLYARATGPYGTGASAAWRQLIDWLAERDRHLNVTTGFGWFRDDPANTNPFLQRYDACIELLPGLGSDFRAGIGRQTLPGGLYIVHEADTAAKDQLCRDGFAAHPADSGSGLAADPDRAMFERVTIDPVAGTWTSLPQLLLPVLEVRADESAHGLRVA